MKAALGVPSHAQLLLGEAQQVIQRLVVDLAVAGPARSSARSHPSMHCAAARKQAQG